MNDKFLIKKCSDNITAELESVNFSKEYISSANGKFKFLSLKIFNLKPAEANILKQTCLSLGFDAAINRYAVNCECDSSDAIVAGSVSQFKNLSNNLSKQPFRLKNLAAQLAQIIAPEISYSVGHGSFSYDQTYLMGILNVTPDSFSDGGKYFDSNDAFLHAVDLIENGADIIDIGGESTRPDSVRISCEEECRRVLPVIKKIREKYPNIILSIDTLNPETAVQAINVGVDIVNNVGAVEIFEPVFDFLKTNKTPIVITHSNCVPPKKVVDDFEGDIVDEICKFFYSKINFLRQKGLHENLLILDVGIGFGKSVNDQFELVKRADEFQKFNLPVLYGISRKSFISNTFGIENRDEAGEIYSQYLIEKKINILRVHDVAKHKKIKNYLSKIM